MTVIPINSSERIEIMLLDSSNAEVTGASATMKIRRKSDGKYWNGTSFQTASTTVAMTQLSAANDPGRYYYIFNTNGLPEDEYYFTADANTGSNVPQVGVVRTGVVPIASQVLPMVNIDQPWKEDEKKKVIELLQELITKIEASKEDAIAMESNVRNNIISNTERAIGKMLESFSAMYKLVETMGNDVDYKQELEAVRKQIIAQMKETSQTLVDTLAESIRSEGDKTRKSVVVPPVADDLKAILEAVKVVEALTMRSAPTELLEELTGD